MHLRVLSYNIHRAIGVDRRFRPERIVKILQHYNADIVLLQEVDEGAPRSRELDLAQEIAQGASYPFYAVGHNVTLRKGRYGNATLSRFPILRRRNLDLTIGTKKRRGCQHTTLEMPPNTLVSQLEVFNLHLGLSSLERDRQIGILSRSREFRDLEEKVPCLVGGDFNDWRSRIRPMFTEILGYASATANKNGVTEAKTYPSFSPTGSLDKIYYRRPLRLLRHHPCRLAVAKIASDHLPIIADFDLRGRHPV